MNPYLVSWLRFNDADNIAKDECGNTWTVLGSPTLTSDNAILGTAGYFPKGSRLICNQPLVSGGRDFSFDFYATVYSELENATMATTQTSFSGQTLQIVYAAVRQSTKLKNYFPNNSTPSGTRHHFAFSYVHETNICLLWLNGAQFVRQTFAIDSLPSSAWFVGAVYTVDSSAYAIIDEFRIFDGIALWTEPFTPPTTEADYDLTELDFSVFMPATRSIIKPIDELADVKRTVDKTAEESANVKSQVVCSENIFSNVKRTVDKTAEESANVKREVKFSTDNDVSPIRRTVNVDDNFANVKRSVVESADNFSPTKRQVLFSEENIFLPHRRTTNLAEEFANVRRLVHEPQVIDIYTRRRLTNVDDNFADTQRKILATSDNLADLNRAVIFTTNNFSPTKRTVNKTATESANVKRQILFSAENDLPSVRRILNADDNFANVKSTVIKTTDNFAQTLRETLRSEICYVETSRRAELLSVIIALKNQQGQILGRIRFQKDKTSSIGHLVTCFNGINFYAGLVDVDSPTAGNFRVFKYGNLYALKEEFL